MKPASGFSSGLLNKLKVVRFMKVDFDSIPSHLNLEFFARFKDVELLMLAEDTREKGKCICMYPYHANATFSINFTGREVLDDIHELPEYYHNYMTRELANALQTNRGNRLVDLAEGGGIVGMSRFTLKDVNKKEMGKSLLQKFTL